VLFAVEGADSGFELESPEGYTIPDRLRCCVSPPLEAVHFHPVTWSVDRQAFPDYLCHFPQTEIKAESHSTPNTSQ